MIRDMDKWTRIRRDVLVEKMSRREACRKYNLNFRTIQKILKLPEPPERPKAYARAKPKIGPFISVIHEILEADKKVHAKQRHTGKRIFDRLRDEYGYTGGITVVRDEIRRWKQQAAEVFMPLAHPPGEAQFDFGEAKAVYRGREIKVMFCVMSLPYSDAFFCQAFRENVPKRSRRATFGRSLSSAACPVGSAMTIRRLPWPESSADGARRPPASSCDSSRTISTSTTSAWSGARTKRAILKAW